MLRQYDVTEGIIRINGIDIKHYRREDLLSRFTCFFQGYKTYAITLKDNIALSDLEFVKGLCTCEDHYIKDILTKVGGEDILQQCSHNTKRNITKLFNSDGLLLSKGQLQKIALARAFYRKSDVVLLDEPTSYLDDDSERSFLNNFILNQNGNIILLVTHKREILKHVDKIINIHNGRVLDISNKYNELL